MKNGKTSAHLRACSRVAARYDELWLRLYVGQKLRSDPVFPAAFALLQDSSAPLVDLGCGVGLLGFYLRERGFAPPVIGLDRDPRKLARAHTVARSGGYSALEFFEQDVAAEPLAYEGNIVLFDLLHYLAPNDQTRLLEHLAARVPPGGMLLLRDCPLDNNRRFRLTRMAERFAQRANWNLRTPLHFPTRETICEFFPPDEFNRTVEPLWGRTPFNNHLFIFRRHTDATLPAEAERSGSLRV